MKKIISAVLISFAVVAAISEGPVYTIHYVKNYQTNQISNNFGCGKSIVYGTCLYPMGLVDAAFKLANPNIYGFNAGCPRPETYVKVFGDAQDYALLLPEKPQIVSKLSNDLKRTRANNVIIQWRYLPEMNKRNQAFAALTRISMGLKSNGFNVFIKAPASYFCLKIDNQNYILSQPADSYIIEMYGEQKGQYISFQAMFSDLPKRNEDGYEENCGKYPSLAALKLLQPSKRIYVEKTLDWSLSGFVQSVRFESFASKAGNQVMPTFFYDDYPEQMIY